MCGLTKSLRGSSDFESLLQISKQWILKSGKVLQCNLSIKKIKQPNTWKIYCMLRWQDKVKKKMLPLTSKAFSLCGILHASYSTLNSLLLWTHVVVIPPFHSNYKLCQFLKKLHTHSLPLCSTCVHCDSFVSFQAN